MSHNTQPVTRNCHYTTDDYLATQRTQRTSQTVTWVFSFYPWYITAGCFTVVVSKTVVSCGRWRAQII